MLTNSFAFTFEDSLIANKSIKKSARKKAHITIKQEKIKVTTKEVLKRIGLFGFAFAQSKANPHRRAGGNHICERKADNDKGHNKPHNRQIFTA